VVGGKVVDSTVVGGTVAGRSLAGAALSVGATVESLDFVAEQALNTSASDTTATENVLALIIHPS